MSIGVLMLSHDRSISDAGSAASRRLRTYEERLGGTIECLVLGSPLNLPTMALTGCRIVRRMRREGKRVLVTTQDPFFLGLVGLVVSRACRAPLHVQIHGDFFSPHFATESVKQYLEAALAPFVIRRAHRVRAVSEKIRAYCIEKLRIAPDVVDVISVRPDLEAIRAATPAPSATVLVIARLVKQKNVPLAVEAFARLARTHKDATLCIAGRGREEQTVRAKIERVVEADPSLAGRITLVPWTDNPGALMKGAKIFLLSSDYEGWGMTVIEAAAAGLPVVMTDIGCAGEFAINNESALIVPVRDADALTRAMDRLLTDSTLHARLKEEAMRRALALPPVETYADMIVEAWKKTL